VVIVYCIHIHNVYPPGKHRHLSVYVYIGPSGCNLEAGAETTDRRIVDVMHDNRLLMLVYIAMSTHIHIYVCMYMYVLCREHDRKGSNGDAAIETLVPSEENN
jgi:hypothetical protein